jgi:hypothetical protein
MMKQQLLMAVICLWAVLYVRPAEAAYVTGEDLVVICDSEKSQDIYSCLNYVAGVIDYHVMMQSLGTAPTTDFCLPEDLPLEQAAVSVLMYLKRHPEHYSFIAAPAVVMALHEAHPCGPMAGSRKKKKR